MLSYSLGEYNDLYVQNDTLLLADISDNFQTTCREIYKPDPARFLTAPGLAWQAAFKRTKVRLDVINVRKRSYRKNVSLYLLV